LTNLPAPPTNFSDVGGIRATRSNLQPPSVPRVFPKFARADVSVDNHGRIRRLRARTHK
jgi:hypothetical protein